MSGTKQRAPEWLQRMGLKWSHRLLSEPRRLGSLSRRWLHLRPIRCSHSGARCLVPDMKSKAAPTHRITGAAPRAQTAGHVVLVGRADADPHEVGARCPYA